jgi:hypothetical protein
VSTLTSIQHRQATALYPELLSLSAQQHRRALYARRRPYTDVVALALRHADLTTEQLCALNEFRLDQFQS